MIRILWTAAIGVLVVAQFAVGQQERQTRWSPTRRNIAIDEAVTHPNAFSRRVPTGSAPVQDEQKREYQTPLTQSPRVAQLPDAMKQIVDKLGDPFKDDTNVPNEVLPAPNSRRQLIPFKVNNSNVRMASKGELVSIVAKDASLNELLSTLARSQKLNLVYAGQTAGGAALGNQGGAGGALPGSSPNGTAGQNAGGGAAGGIGLDPRVTVSLENVHLETALDTILSVVGFTWTRTEGVILVTPSSEAANLPPNAQGRTMQVFELDFATAEDVDLAVKGLLSPVGQSFAHSGIATDNRRSKEMVVVEDLPRYIDRIANYISQFDVAPRQVAIEAYVLQVDLEGETRHGVNWNYFARLADPSIRVGANGFANSAASQAFFLEIDGQRLDTLLEALRTTLDAKTLASPRLIAVNGQEARLQVGEQLGFRVTTTTQTSTLESVEFINVGVVLSVTPRISRDGRILLRISPEISSGQVNPTTGLPQEETAELQTDVVLTDGQGIVVGGLIREDITDDQSKIPGLGDIPYVGAAFGRRKDLRQRSEIIVALIPRILPVDAQQQALNDRELIRATTPLLQSSLVENPRPFEPKLSDPVRDKKRRYDIERNNFEYQQDVRYAAETPMTDHVRDTEAKLLPTATSGVRRPKHFLHRIGWKKER